MMSPENFPAENVPARMPAPSRKPPPEQEPLKCPRCDSMNTKFCYYNNYSLTQPRHFCKTCRRYWTKGGALRNVPVGGGCRKSKKSTKPTSSLSSRVSLAGDSKNLPPGDLIGGGLKFLHSISGPPPATEHFNLGGLSLAQLHPNPTTTTGIFTNFSPLTGDSPGDSAGGLLGLNYSMFKTGENSNSMINSRINEINPGYNQVNNLSVSIESLSSMNQELHWKLQQQRLAMLYSDSDGGGPVPEKAPEWYNMGVGSNGAASTNSTSSSNNNKNNNNNNNNNEMINGRRDFNGWGDHNLQIQFNGLH